MAASLGRENTIMLDGVTVLCWRTLDESVTNSLVDITQNCSNGFNTSLTTAGERMVAYSIEGIMDDATYRDMMLNGVITLPAAVMTYADGATLTGDLVISEFSNSYPYNEAVTFSASLQTSGAYVFAPAP